MRNARVEIFFLVLLFSLRSGLALGQASVPSTQVPLTPAQAEQARIRNYRLINLPIGVGFRVTGVRFRPLDRLVYLQDRGLRYLDYDAQRNLLTGPRSVRLDRSRCVLRLKESLGGWVTVGSSILRTQGISQGPGYPDLSTNRDGVGNSMDPTADYVHLAIRHPRIDGLYCQKRGADSGEVEEFQISDFAFVAGDFLQFQLDAPRVVWNLGPGQYPGQDSENSGLADTDTEDEGITYGK